VRVSLAGGAHPNIRAELAALPGVAAVEPVVDAEGEGLIVLARDGRPMVAEIAERARDRGWAITTLRVERGRLDDVFREITAAPPQPTPTAAAA
jgi:ABC-2 type transport system ATP-binding protein